RYRIGRSNDWQRHWQRGEIISCRQRCLRCAYRSDR
ncbi:2-aminoethylphosphonate--pyruvate transaminase, partial [Vibrio parahaemolyticus V-223/04]